MLFAGVRPDGELFKLGRPENADRLINTRTKKITIEEQVSKVNQLRKVDICDNLERVVEPGPGPVLPPNADRHIKAFRVPTRS
jgi:hypothetical protein